MADKLGRAHLRVMDANTKPATETLTPSQRAALGRIAAARTWGVGSWRDEARASRPVQISRVKVTIATARALERKGLLVVSTPDVIVGWGPNPANATLTAAGLAAAL